MPVDLETILPKKKDNTQTGNNLNIQETTAQRIQRQKELFSTVDPRVIELVQDADRAERERQNYLGSILSIGGELTTGITGQALAARNLAIKRLHTTSKVVGTLSKAQKATAVGVAGPQILEPWSTGSFLLSSGASWVAGNFVGQSIRKAFGLQEGISYGELLATGVFGTLTAPLMVPGSLTIGKKGAEKQLLKLTGQTAADYGAYKKGGYLIINGAKSFVSGAALGIAETAVRQELQVALNERENRDTYEYLFAGAFGGGLNSIFQVWNKAGWWGRRQRTEVTEAAKNNVEFGIEKLENELAKVKNTKYFIPFQKGRKIKKLEQQIQDSEKALELIDSAVDQFKKLEGLEQKLETGEVKPDFSEEIQTNVGTKIEPKEDPYLVDDVQSSIDKYNEIKNNPTPEASSIDTPRLRNDATVIRDDIDNEIANTLGRINKIETAGENPSIEYKKLKQLIYNKQQLDKEVISPIDTSIGRTMASAADKGGDYLDYTTTRSQTSLARSGAYKELLESIDNVIKTVEAPSITASTFKNIFKTLDLNLEEIKKVNEQKAKTTRTSSKPPKITAISEKVTAGQIEKLEKQLEEIRATGVNVGKKRKNVPKAVDEEKQILQDKIKFYKRAAKEIQQISQMQRELDELYKTTPKEYKAKSDKAKKKAEFLKKTQQNTKIKELETKVKNAKRTLSRLAKKAEKLEKQKALADYEVKMRREIEGDIEELSIFQKTGRFLTWYTAQRKSALLSTSSAIAGIPTGLYEMLGEFVGAHLKVIGSFFTRKKNPKTSLPLKNYMADMSAFFTAIFDFKDNLGAGWHVARKREPVTFSENLNEKLGINERVPATTSRGIKEVKVSPAKQKQAQKDLISFLEGNIVTGSFLKTISIARGMIFGTDEVLKRTVAKMRSISDARRRAILKDHTAPDPKKTVADIEKEILDGEWIIGEHGFKSLKLNEENAYDINRINETLFMGSNADNIEDLHQQVIEVGIKGFEKFFKSHPVMDFISSFFAPFLGVTVRSIYRGARLTTGAGLYLYRNESLSNFIYKMNGKKEVKGIGNPYLNKLLPLRKEIEIEKSKIIDPETIPLTGKDREEFIIATKNKIADLTKRANILEIRKTKYNQDIITDAVMGTSMWAGAFIGSQTTTEKVITLENGETKTVKVPLITGPLSFLSYEERLEVAKIGIEPYTAFGIDYRSALPFATPIGMVAEQGNFIYFDEELKRIDRTKQNYLSTAFTSMFQIWNDLPFNQTGKIIDNLTFKKQQNKQEVFDDYSVKSFKEEIGKLVGTLGITPGDFKKIMKVVNNDGKIPDLKNATFEELASYSSYGGKIRGYKLDRYGDPIKSSLSMLRYFLRFGPSKEASPNLLEYYMAYDASNDIEDELDIKISDLKLKDYRDSQGDTMMAMFGLKLKKTGVKKAVENRLKQETWLNKFNNGAQKTDEKGRSYNEGLREIDDMLKKYESRVKKQIEKDSNLMKNFKNSEGNTFFEEYRKIKLNKEVTRQVKPF